MMKCPNCGYEAPTPPYEYQGWLKPYLPMILELLHAGVPPSDVADKLRAKHGASLSYDPSAAMINYIRNKYGINAAAIVGRQDRNDEIVKRYHGEDITMTQLGREFGLSAARVSLIIAKAERAAEAAAKRKSVVHNYKRIEDVPIELLDLSARSANCLYNEKCETVGDVMQRTDGELMRMPNFGRRSVREVRECIEQLKATFHRPTIKAEASL
jgi:hypothetical protein